MTRHPFVTAAAIALTIFILAVAPCLWLARLVDDALRTTPRPTRHNTFPRSLP